MLVCAKTQSENLGDISVKSISVLNEQGVKSISLRIIDGAGFLSTYNADGKETAYLGTAEGGGGHLETFNDAGVQTGYFGTNIDNDGMIALYDRYGDGGWSASGKQ